MSMMNGWSLFPFPPHSQSISRKENLNVSATQISLHWNTLKSAWEPKDHIAKMTGHFVDMLFSLSAFNKDNRPSQPTSHVVMHSLIVLPSPQSQKADRDAKRTSSIQSGGPVTLVAQSSPPMQLWHHSVHCSLWEGESFTGVWLREHLYPCPGGKPMLAK